MCKRQWLLFAAKVVALLLCMFALWGLLSPASAETMWVITEGDPLTGRSKPRLSAHAECYFQNGEEIEILAMADGWAKADYGGEAECSYVSWDFLTDNDDTQYKVNAPGGLNVRNNPDGDRVVGELKDGTIVDVIFIFDGWAKVKKGWVKTWYLDQVGLDLSIEAD